MVHTLFKKSYGFIWLCLLGSLWFIWYWFGKQDYYELLKIIGFVIVFVIVDFLLYYKTQAKEYAKYSGTSEGNAGYISWCLMGALDNICAINLLLVLLSFVGLISRIAGIHIPTTNEMSVFVLVYGLLTVICLNSKGDLSAAKLIIVAFCFTPVVAYLLIKYSKTHAKERAEEYTERAKQSIERGEYSEAIHFATEGIEICPKVKDADYQLSRCYYWRAQAYQKMGENLKAEWDLAKMKALEATE